MTTPDFDLHNIVKALQDGTNLSGKDGALTPLIKQLTEAAMQAELNEYLASENSPNRKNGTMKKTIKGPTDSFELETPRDRTGTFEPQIVKNTKPS